MNAPHHQNRLEAELGRAVVRIAELEEENAWLKQRLHPVRRTPLEWGLGPKEEEFVLALYGISPGICTFERAIELVWPDAYSPGKNYVRVLVTKCRIKLRRHGVEIRNVTGRGYILSADGAKAIRDYNRV